MNKESLRKTLNNKLNTIRYELLTQGSSRVSREFFFVSVENGVSHGLSAFKMIDLAQTFPEELTDFAKRHNVKVYSTSQGYEFK